MPQFLVCPDDVDAKTAKAVIRGDEAHHLLAVLRVRRGDPVLLFDGTGHRWSARVEELRPGLPEVRLADLKALPSNEPSLRLSLIQAMPKGDRWEWLLEKGTELGVNRFVPVHSTHGVVHIAERRGTHKKNRWNSIVTAAAKQCERGRIPDVALPKELPSVLSSLPKICTGEERLVSVPRMSEPHIPSVGPIRRVLLAVGPEGGWTVEELEAFEKAGFRPLGLGPRILRSETAAICAIVVSQSLWGGLVTSHHLAQPVPSPNEGDHE